MVFINRVELTHFKSFGGTVSVPLLPGFTVVSGPNGSGKSNILDALLFCLGLASSKGMRAERLPDLVNHKHRQNRQTAETTVSVTFDLTDWAATFGNDESDPPTVTNGNGHHGEDSNVSRAELDSPLDLENYESNEASVDDISALEPAPDNDRSTLSLTPDESERENIFPQGLTDPLSSEIGGAETPVNQKSQRKIADFIPVKVVEVENEAKVSLEWTISRRLRLSKNGSYSSTYYINGEVCTATELHEQLSRLRINAEGYNVVLQGDVTRIITMNSRERREIIDELAGVAAFDRKIDKARDTLESVREKEERCRIIEQELIATRDRLAADRIKAEKYRQLRIKVEGLQRLEQYVNCEKHRQELKTLRQRMAAGVVEAEKLTAQLADITKLLAETQAQRDEWNTKVKALGEDEQLAAATKLANLKAQQTQLQERQATLTQQQAQNTQAQAQIQAAIATLLEQISGLENESTLFGEKTLPELVAARDTAKTNLQTKRDAAAAIAENSNASLNAQSQLLAQLAEVQRQLDPLRQEQTQLTERERQLTQQLGELAQQRDSQQSQSSQRETEVSDRARQNEELTEQIQALGTQLAQVQQELTLQQETQNRLLREQRDKQRQLDKLEAAKEAQQQAQGTYATKAIMRSQLSGICGLVSQLGQVDPEYQLALETAAGGRLGQIVVESDAVAAAGIALLKQERAGRATFLPLNKIRAPRSQNLGNLAYARGFIDLAVNLVTRETRYDEVFAYVFGGTVVFASINEARAHLGKARIVTLEGDLLEMTGAMSGGSRGNRSAFHFGAAAANDSLEIETLQARLAEIAKILGTCDRLIAQKNEQISQLTQAMTEARQLQRESQLRFEQSQTEQARISAEQQQYQLRWTQSQQEAEQVQTRLQALAITIPPLEQQLAQLQQEQLALGTQDTTSEWQTLQAEIRTSENSLAEQENRLQAAQQQQRDREAQILRLQEKRNETQTQLTDAQAQSQALQTQQLDSSCQLDELAKEIAATETTLNNLSDELRQAKETRDKIEAQVHKQQTQQQQITWQQQKLQEIQTNREQTQTELQAQLAQLEADLPPELPDEPWPDLSEVDCAKRLEELRHEIKNGQKRLQAMEPVNMLALEEYERTEARLNELSNKLATLEEERTELLLRVENFTTLRRRAFREAYDAVNINFQRIFAELSDGDGSLHLDDEEDPFNGGLNLIAHPKGKPVQRLSSMSGGEKSLTALSFIFALQRYRPSPFYAFDEVDMFLDGANVERLSAMIQKQAQQAQFIVVSLRRPMIEAAERTIGVTQARGAHTQVLGLNLS
ncbi:MAG: chromosome segregation protein SMC [Cyanobacteria bacterium P01_H01_bin.15]